MFWRPTSLGTVLDAIAGILVDVFGDAVVGVEVFAEALVDALEWISEEKNPPLQKATNPKTNRSLKVKRRSGTIVF